MTTGPLIDLATATLDAIRNHWPIADPPTVLALPTRAYSIVGTPAADCEQLVVGLERIDGSEGSAAQSRTVPLGQGAPYLRTAVFAVQILRCVSVVDDNGKAPAASKMQAESFAQMNDADTVLECIIAAQGAGELAGCSGMALVGWQSQTAQGGLSGGVTRLRLNTF